MLGRTTRARLCGEAAVRRMLNPRSVAVIGVSTRPGSAGYNTFTNLASSGYAGEIYLVGRSGGTIEGRACLTSIDELPEGIDLAIFTLPSSSVREAVDACIARKVRCAVVFAAGFSELGGIGHDEQLAISRAAQAGGLALLGPNCLGYSNLVNGLRVGFFPAGAKQKDFQGTDGIAILGQSGLLVVHIRAVLEARKLGVSHFVTTGNEAGLTLSDFLEYFASDASTRAIAVFAEHVRRPSEFLAATAKVRAAGKAIIMLHTGKSERAKADGAFAYRCPCRRLCGHAHDTGTRRHCVRRHAGGISGCHRSSRAVSETADQGRWHCVLLWRILRSVTRLL